ncbi:MAG: hypothetical protein RMX68_011325 [Aulosira sp. ZfuVER01]|nr:hypothetical protein [Aulosira sp. DedVER01a]MDZ8050559.1 hypothetical protein [Aulosira sp. ZfuCHP01]
MLWCVALRDNTPYMHKRWLRQRQGDRARKATITRLKSSADAKAAAKETV